MLDELNLITKIQKQLKESYDKTHMINQNSSRKGKVGESQLEKILYNIFEKENGYIENKSKEYTQLNEQIVLAKDAIGRGDKSVGKKELNLSSLKRNLDLLRAKGVSIAEKIK